MTDDDITKTAASIRAHGSAKTALLNAVKYHVDFNAQKPYLSKLLVDLRNAAPGTAEEAAAVDALKAAFNGQLPTTTTPDESPMNNDLRSAIDALLLQLRPAVERGPGKSLNEVAAVPAYGSLREMVEDRNTPLQEKLADKRIPVELRLRMACQAVSETLPTQQAYANLSQHELLGGNQR